MNIFNGFITGISAYREAADILFSRKFRWFLLFPVLILMALFVGGNMFVSWGSDSLYKLVEGKIGDWVHGVAWLQWMDNFTGFLIKIALKIIYFFLFITLGGYIVLIIMSPVYSWLSEKTEAHLTGKKYPFSFRQLIREIFRGIWIALRNMVLQLLLSLLLFFCTFLPLVGLLVPFALFFLSAYFYGFSFVDYVIERKKFNIRERVTYVNKNTGLVIGLGCLFALALMIPWGNIIACSFVSLLSVVAATVAIHKTEPEKAL